MKHKKKVILICIAILLILMIPLGFAAKTLTSKVFAYEINWDIKLPNHMKELYNEENLGFTGDGASFTVFQTKSVSADFFTDFSKMRDENVENLIAEITSDWLQVPNDKLPNWEDEYHSKMIKNNSSDFLCMIYFPNTMQLIVASLEI